MKCPYCWIDNNKVCDGKRDGISKTRGDVSRRTRLYLNCGKKFKTVEYIRYKERGKEA